MANYNFSMRETDLCGYATNLNHQVKDAAIVFFDREKLESIVGAILLFVFTLCAVGAGISVYSRARNASSSQVPLPYFSDLMQLRVEAVFEKLKLSYSPDMNVKEVESALQARLENNNRRLQVITLPDSTHDHRFYVPPRVRVENADTERKEERAEYTVAPD